MKATSSSADTASTRNNNVDLLRFIGLSMIILAHVGPPEMIFQLRNFDVPLMLIVSGMSFGFAFKEEPYSQYVWKRIKRLVFPVWIFLSLYFVFFSTAETNNYEVVLNSYFLLGGIGYVWIIRVFLLVALLAPFIYHFHKRTDSDSVYLYTLLTIFIFYEICRHVTAPYIVTEFGRIASLIILYAIPYSLLFALGLRIPTLTEKSNKAILLAFLICFALLTGAHCYTSGEFVPTQQFKYPPTIYYFSYAISVSVFLWLSSYKIWEILQKNKMMTNFVLFMARNSIWIYLWHIPLVKLIHFNYLLKYFIVIPISLLIAYSQTWMVNNIFLKNISNDQTRKNIKMILTG